VQAPAPGIRQFPLPIVAATEIQLVSSLSEAIAAEQGAALATVTIRLASGRGEFSFPIRAGIETAEWAHERPDVRVRVRHRRPPTTESWRPRGASYDGHRYLARLRLPGRYNVDAIRLALGPSSPPLLVSRVRIADDTRAQTRAVSALSAYVSDSGTFREAASTPALRLFERPHVSRAWVVEGVRVMPDAGSLLEALARINSHGIDPQREALVEEGALATAGVRAPPAGVAGRAEIVRWGTGRIDLRAEGPGFLLAAESWNAGWSARVDGSPVPVLRANHAAMAVALPAGAHRISFRYTPPGLLLGTMLAGLAIVALAAAALRRRS